ncbi:MAG: PolC-type DNA polymerase III [Lachnospiraceae bacterium]|nr:PolC-type DNA polymerase III [Lachnospiraceae bacterium]
MSLFDVFTGLEVKKNVERSFADVDVDKVKACKGKKKVTIVLNSVHLIEYRDIKSMEEALAMQFFNRTGNQVELDVHYSLSSQYDPESLWNMAKSALLDELSAMSKMNNIFLDNADICFEKKEDGRCIMVISSEDTFINRMSAENIKDFLRKVFSERYNFDVEVDFRWRECETPEYEHKEEVYYMDAPVEITPVKKRITERGIVEPNAEKTAEQEKTAENKALETADVGNEQKEKPGETKADAGSKDKFQPKVAGFKQEFKARSKFIKKKLEEDPDLFYGNLFDSDEAVTTPLSEIQDSPSQVYVFGKIINVEEPTLTRKKDRYIVKFSFTDMTDSVYAKLFPLVEDKDELLKYIAKGNCIKMKACARFDAWDKEIEMADIVGIKQIPDFIKKRKDTSEEKRIELHAHTTFSDMDAVIAPETLIKTAFDFGHPGVAITDHGVVQGYTDAFHFYRDKLAKSKDPEVAERAKNFKIIYGCEIYLVNDLKEIVKDDGGQTFDAETVVFDIETTGIAKSRDKIIEIGAVKLRNNEIVDRYSVFVNPEIPIPTEIVTLTHITDDMVKDADVIENELKRFLEFCGDAVIVAHNAPFDTGFIKRFAKEQGIEWKPTIVDTVELSKGLIGDLKNYKLDTVADELGVSLENHHRAVDDAECTALIYQKLCDILKKKDYSTLSDISENLKASVDSVKKLHPFHCIVLIKNETGRINLYKMISQSHLTYFNRTPRIPKSMLAARREGLIIGSACEAGELYRAIVEGATQDEIDSLCEFYDYYEIQPLGNNNFMLDDEKLPNISSEDDLKLINEKIVKLGETYNKPVCATTDCHFLNPEDEVYRRLIMHSKGFKDADRQPPLYFRTTEEMLAEFDYLGLKKCHEVVIDNPKKIYDMIEKIEPVRPDKCPPIIEHSEEMLTKICHDKAHSMYGEKLPVQVETRLEKELSSIIKNGYSVMYIIAQKLVWKSNEDGYLVGSRGSVGSSFVATMAGISEINPLPAHYYCKKCHYSDFDSEEVKEYQHQAICGFDMPDKVCPVCGEQLVKDGCDIPFETFLGFNCDKEPDIDLNFSGEYQSKAHDYTEVIFGKGQTFKAGTVGTVAEKTAYGYALKYDEDHGIHHRRAELERVSAGCVGVRRATGQHPGGIVVLPVGEDIDTFTPVQHPANDMESNIITTHFDYHSIDHNLLKLDILGHDDPTMIKRLEELTGIDAKTIPMDDKKVISLFHGTESLGITPEDLNGIDMGSLGLPELGTDNAMNMLRETKPDCFSDMVRISGLSHGTDVYTNNAQDLIKSGTCNLKQAICTRDDIMLYLINKGLEPGHAFKIMESVRKGKGLTEEWEAEMKEHDVPDWYIGSCKKIKYMFPKAHAAAYIMMAFRVAWFKVYHPLAYYAAYFGIRAAAFDYELMCLGKEKLLKNMKEIKANLDNHTAKAKDETTYMNMKSVLEMYARGLEFMPIDIFKAKAHAFQVIDGKVMPSFDSIQGLGEKASDLMYEGCKGGPFTSKENFKERTKAPQSAVDTMSRLGLLGDIPETDQISLMDLFDMN